MVDPWRLATVWSLLGALAFVGAGDPHAHAGVVVTVLLAWAAGPLLAGRTPTAPRGASLVLAALAVRAILLFSPPTLSDDVYRYVWEGEVWRAGHNPFAAPPDAPELVGLRDEIWALVNHREVSSVYPPLAQLLFVVLAGGGPLAWKLAMGLADAATAVLLGRRDPRAGWMWALLPLPVVESAGSGHLEGAGVLLLVVALGGSGAAAWAAGMVKLLPGVVLLPHLGGSMTRPAKGASWGRRAARGLGWALTSVVITLPILAAGDGAWRGLETYRAIWAYNGSLYALLGSVMSDDEARRLLQLVGAAVTGGILLRSRDPGRIALWITGAFVLLSPTVHPWYVLWPLAAALWNGSRPWEWFAAGVPLAYIVLGTYDAATSSWSEPLWPRFIYYPVLYGLLGWEGARRLTRAGPAPV